MSKPTDIAIKDVQIEIEQFNYRTPIKFGGRTVTDVDHLLVEITVEDRRGNVASGNGAMPLGNIWAWPSKLVTAIESLNTMRDFADSFYRILRENKSVGHPVEVAHDISLELDERAKRYTDMDGLAELMPKLAQLVVFSPFDAAIHDAYGRLLNRSSYDCLSSEFMNRDISHYLSSEFAGQFLDRYTLRTPKPSMPLYHLVGALDPVLPEELKSPVEDGLPETLGQWIETDGLTHLKIKLNGEDLDWDVQRVLDIEQVSQETQKKLGRDQRFYSVDFNEKCENVEYVIEFVEQVKSKSNSAFDRIQYIEQPTHRDLRQNPENKMFEAAKLKPVVIDESLVDFETFLLAREQGYSGVALKACKGHSEALLMGAAAQHFEMFLCVQDLTCIGASFLHSASLAARIPTVAAIEGNGRQYCPAGNEPFVERFPGMFDIRDGTVKTGELNGIGLGF